MGMSERQEQSDQPAREPDSYWVGFPDDSILRRTHQVIKLQVATFSF